MNVSGLRTDPYRPWGNDTESSEQFAVSFGEDSRYDSRLRFCGQTCQAKEHHPGVDLSHAKHEFAEVFIRRNQQGAMLGSSTQHGSVINTWFHFCNVLHGVAILAQAVNDESVHAFVCQQVHMLYPTVG